MDKEDLEFLESLKEEFFAESEDVLAECESLMLEYGQKQDDQIIKNYMRILHSMKGSASAVDLKRLSKVLHGIESYTKNCKAANYVDVNLKIIDLLRNYLDATKNGDESSAEAPISAMEKTLGVV